MQSLKGEICTHRSIGTICRSSHKAFDFLVVLPCEEKVKDGECGERGCVLEGLRSTGVRSGPGIFFIRCRV